jgi:hypothetical protein
MTAADFAPTTLYRALRRPDGRYVCIDLDYLTQTTKVVREIGDYYLAKSLGWCDHPSDALARLDAEEEQRANDAAVRNFDDRHLSERARAEADEAVSHTIRHVADIPVAPKRGRGRPKKQIVGA